MGSLERAVRTIGVITNDRYGDFQGTVIEGLKNVFEANTYALVIDPMAEHPSERQPVSLNIPRLSGLIVIANIMPDDYLRQIHITGKPMVLVSHQVPDMHIPAVMVDNREGIGRMVDFLVKTCGSRKTVFIQGDLNQVDGQQRTTAFIQSMQRHDLEVDPAYLLHGNFDIDTAVDSLRAFLARGLPFDAVAAADYKMAIVATEILREKRVSIPDAVRVVGFGDGEDAADVGLTTVGVDVVRLGERAAYQLIGQMDGMEILGTTLLSTVIIRRDTA
jgi:DNA-binding LacI/PurR family transcriptional regulator